MMLLSDIHVNDLILLSVEEDGRTFNNTLCYVSAINPHNRQYGFTIYSPDYDATGGCSPFRFHGNDPRAFVTFVETYGYPHNDMLDAPHYGSWNIEQARVTNCVVLGNFATDANIEDRIPALAAFRILRDTLPPDPEAASYRAKPFKELV